MEGLIKSENAEVLAFAGYKDFEAAADRTAVKIKEGYLEMGYILKMARDTDILRESGYTGYEEFAEKRYGLDKGTVSRYIRIVERFSVDGNSHILKDSYRDMGFAKLSIMLHMPDAIAEELMDTLSKAEVQAIREEIDAEAKISDIELTIEKSETAAVVPPVEETMLTRAVWQLGREQQDLYWKLWKALEGEETQKVKDILAPQGDAVYMPRIPGTGRIMLAISGQTVSVTNVRSQEKERYSMGDLLQAVENICQVAGADVEESFRRVYDAEMEPMPPKREVAPVQPKKAEPRKQSKVTKAKTPVPAAVTQAEEKPEEQLPGQMDVRDYEGVVPEANFKELPEKKEEGKNGENKETAGGRETREESVSVGEPAEGTGAAESGGCEADNGDGCKLGTLVSIDICGCRVYPPRNAADRDDLTKTWDETVLKVKKLAEFAEIWKWTPPENINKEQLLTAYQEAINAAAGLEKLINMRGQAHE